MLRAIECCGTSNLEFSQWDTVFGDDRLTADRLVHHAHILAFTGDSYRLKNALSHQS
nr:MULTISPECIES: ATP-binding protein [Thermoactinomyces]